MEEEQKLYGRRRVKKHRLQLPASPTEADRSTTTESGPSIRSEPERDGQIQSDMDTFDASSSARVDTEPKVKSSRAPLPTSRPRNKDKPSRKPSQPRDKSRPRARRSPSQRPAVGRRRLKVSVVVPAYNEEGNIKPLMERFKEVIDRAGKDWEVILVDDGSTDKTAERARDAAIYHHWLRVISYPNHRGLTAALNEGFRQAKGSIFVFYPADLQYHPQDIPRMVAKIERGADVVAGWRQGKYRKWFVSYTYNKLSALLFNVGIHDQNSVKAFRREVLESITLRRDWHRYLVALAADAGFRIDEVKVDLYPRHSGKSKFGTGRIIGGLLDLLSVKFQLSFTKKPLRFFGGWGMLSGLLGVALGLVAVYLRFFTTHGSRTLLYLVILLILSGLMLFAIGFLAEVIVDLREEIESLKSKR